MDNKKRFAWILIMVVIVLVAAVIIYPTALASSGYKAYQEIEGVSGAVLDGPEEIVQAFYNGYIAHEGNPLVDKIYQNRMMLTDDFIAYMDDFTATEIHYDPILCAQDRPERIITGKAEISGDLATVPVLSNFAGHSFEVKLLRVDDAWQIDRVVCDTK
jgi:hypothetical protein